ncbi:phage tail assembly chaperone [Veillonella atypica]|uniref:Phage portal protein n=1 Tax=Veillonella atypica TaxID=39777 RepID=A0A3A6WBZ8_9FIRM|nr:phage portal protein [Veillonella atypica]RJY50468.1 phage portal protein [Veillonella atypica]
MSDIKNMSLNGFFKSNAKSLPDVKVVVSERFTNEDGTPIEWVLHPISTKKVEEITKRNTKTTIKNGKKESVVNEENLNAELLEAVVLYPSLNDADLQDSYGVSSANELLSVMLYPGETQVLTNALQEVMAGTKANDIDELKN